MIEPEQADDQGLEDDRASTCRREAPSVRSVASSRIRCATVIASVLAITKLPTKSAMPAKPSRAYLMMFSPSWVSLAVRGGLIEADLHLRRPAGAA